MSSIARQYDPIPDVDLLRVDTAAVAEEARAALDRLVGWLSGADPATPVPGLDWTLHDLAAHLSIDLYSRLAQGEASPIDLARRAEQSAALLAERNDIPMPELLERMRRESEAIEAAVAGRPSTDPVAWHNGAPLTVGLMVSNVLNELLLHGLDAARAVGALPVLPRRAALLGCPSALTTALYVYRPPARPVDARIEMRIRGAGSLVWRFEGDRVRIEPPAGPVDLHVSADPVKFLLVGYGRMPMARSIATGGLLAWGRRPWVATLLQRFESP